MISFIVCFVALAAIFNIFTLFELWRFIAVTQVGAGLVARYLFFLLPLVAVELFPATMLISVLVTYALLARRQEAIAWWASGQSVYRLMLPGLIFALMVASGSWLIQEHLMPGSNLRQDALRARIRGGEARAITHRTPVARLNRHAPVLFLRVRRGRKFDRTDCVRARRRCGASRASGHRQKRGMDRSDPLENCRD